MLETNMYQLIEWFQIHFPELHNDLLLCNHNYDEKDLNPYHLESDCWSHTMMVCKVAELYEYDKVVQIAALLHDIGKPQSRRINPSNNHIQFFGHEELSSKMAIEILDLMMDHKMITSDVKTEIVELIEKHAILHKVNDEKVLYEAFKNRKTFYIHLVQLNRCDSLGRFCADNNFDDEKYQKLIAYSKEYK